MEMKSWRTPNPMPAEGEIAETLTADLVIVGGGQAGTCAARAATENGATVIVIEKKKEKFMSYNGGGQVGQINSEFAISRGIPEVDLVEFVTDWQLRSNNRSNPGLIMNFAKNSGPCMDWILSRLTPEQRDRIEIRHMTLDGKTDTLSTDNSGIKTWVGCVCLMLSNQAIAMNALRHESEANGATWLYQSTGWCLIQENGTITGVIAKNGEGKYIRCLANKGVLLASGDFGGNTEMVKDLCTEPFDTLDDLNLRAMAGCDGIGHKLGYWAGGKMEPRPLSSMGGNYSYPGGSPNDPIGTTAALWLNTHGKRYCNEGFGDVVLAAVHGLRQPKGKLSVVFDSKIIEQVKVQAPGHLSFDYTSEVENKGLKQEMDRAMGIDANYDESVRVGAPKGETHNFNGPDGMPPMGGPGGPGNVPPMGGPGDPGNMPPMGGPGGPGGMPPMGGSGGPGGPPMGGPGGPGGMPPMGGHDDFDGPGGPPDSVTLLGSDTLEGLADKLGYTSTDKEQFLASVARYNEKCYAGYDDDFGKAARLLFPIDTPPYFGYQSEKKPGPFMCTTGGLLTDENQNVLNADYEPIPGLFATGNVCGGRFGAQYTTPVSGISIGMAQTMGRVAGIYIAGLDGRS